MNNKFYEVFGHQKPVIGMIHTNSDSEMTMLELAQREIEIYLQNGVYPLVEDYYGSEEDCEKVMAWIHSEHPEAIYGVNMLGDYSVAFELAEKYGAKFIQIDSVCGHEEPSEDILFAKDLETYRMKSNAIVLGGVRFKYQPVLSGRTLKEDLLLGAERCDAIVCTGSGTGISTPMDKVKDFKTHLGDFPVIVGAGVTLDTAKQTFIEADGAIVGSWFKYMHEAYDMVNEVYVKDFMAEIREQQSL